jgi:ABC-2 type transport system permease protein
MRFLRVKALSKKEFIQIYRDPRSLALAVVIPVLLLFLFGYALTLDVDNVPMVIWDQDSSNVSRDFILNFQNSRYFKIIGYCDNYRDIQEQIDESRALMALVIPKDFSKIIQLKKQAPVQLLVDGSDSNTATIASGYVFSVVGRYNTNFLLESSSKAGIHDPQALELRTRVWFNENLKSRNFIIPGMIVVIMMIITALLTSLTVSREWERGTMEQLISTPIKKSELILGKFLPYFVIGFLDLLIAVGMSQFIYHVPLRGSIVLLFLLSALFLTGGLLLGIFLSIVAKNQYLASQLAFLTTFLPAFLLSGFTYAISNMPKAIQVITYFFPARYFITILKGIFLKGTGLKFLWQEALFLFLFAGLMSCLALSKLKKKIA